MSMADLSRTQLGRCRLAANRYGQTMGHATQNTGPPAMAWTTRRQFAASCTRTSAGPATAAGPNEIRRQWR